MKILALLAPAAWLLTAGAAQAQYPDRPVRIIVPFIAGSAPDGAARQVAQRLTASLGQQFVVDNKPGVAGNIGAEVAARAAPDGYSLMLMTSSHVLAPSSTPVNYDALKDFVPVTMLTRIPSLMVVPPSSPARSVELGIADLVAAGSRSAAELASATATDPAALYRLLRALASIGVFHEDERGVLALTPSGKLLRRDHPPRSTPWCGCSAPTTSGGRGARSGSASARVGTRRCSSGDGRLGVPSSPPAGQRGVRRGDADDGDLGCPRDPRGPRLRRHRGGRRRRRGHGSAACGGAGGAPRYGECSTSSPRWCSRRRPSSSRPVSESGSR